MTHSTVECGQYPADRGPCVRLVLALNSESGSVAGLSWVLVSTWAGPALVWPSWEDVCCAAPVGRACLALLGESPPPPQTVVLDSVHRGAPLIRTCRTLKDFRT